MCLVEPMVTVCVVGNAIVIVQADHSSRKVMEGVEKGEESVGGPEGGAGQIGEILRDVVKSP
jgi:hypothetical protein